MKIIDLVQKTAGTAYMNYGAFEDALYNSVMPVHTLLGAGVGLAGEVGEFNEILKKHIFQEKEFDIDHAKKELGDIYWYFALACIGLGTTPEEIEELVSAKLLARYAATDGRFTKEQSENRKKDDV